MLLFVNGLPLVFIELENSDMLCRLDDALHDYTADVIGTWATAANRVVERTKVEGLRSYTRHTTHGHPANSAAVSAAGAHGHRRTRGALYFMPINARSTTCTKRGLSGSSLDGKLVTLPSGVIRYL